MSNMYDDFEKRFNGKTFSAGWVEVNTAVVNKQIMHKDAETLQAELDMINETLEDISQKKLRLANLAKLYNQ